MGQGRWKSTGRPGDLTGLMLLDVWDVRASVVSYLLYGYRQLWIAQRLKVQS